MKLNAKDPLQKRIEITNWIILAVLFIFSVIITPIKFALGILIGGFISIVNFRWMERGLQGFFEKTSGNVKGPVMIKVLSSPGHHSCCAILFDCQRNRSCYRINYWTFRGDNQHHPDINHLCGKKNFIEEVH